MLVLTGAGRGFCAGQDLGDRAVAPGGARADLGESIERNYKPLVLALRELPVPMIAAVNGVAAGAGANIALACDLVIAATSASFIQSFGKLGLVPDSGGPGSCRGSSARRARSGLAMLGEQLAGRPMPRPGDSSGAASTTRSSRRPSIGCAGELAAAPTRGLARTREAI